MASQDNKQGRGSRAGSSVGRLFLSCIAALAFLAPAASFALNPAPGDAPGSPPNSPPNYLAEGNRYRSNGECEKALENYAKARELRQFLPAESYDLAAAECYIVLKRYDEAVESYTRAIAGTRNRALLSELYRSRGKAYYLKAAQGPALDMAYLALAQRDLKEASASGADVADIEQSIAHDLKVKKPLSAPPPDEHRSTVTGKEVAVIESRRKMVVGDGEYTLHLSRTTRITDRDAQPLTVFDVRPGDIVDFTYSNGYRNAADAMMHVSALTVTLHRSVPLQERAEGEADRQEEELQRMTQRIDDLERAVGDLKEQQEKKEEEKPPAVLKQEAAPDKKPKKKKPLAAKNKASAKPAGAAEKAAEKQKEDVSRKSVEESLRKIRQHKGLPAPPEKEQGKTGEHVAPENHPDATPGKDTP
ncbi:MAG: tetratricopeptide repeat protein [Thermodesulfovibrionales bacterium]